MKSCFNLLRPVVVAISLIAVIDACSSADESPQPEGTCMGLQLQVTSVLPEGCSLANGAITVNASGGQSPYRFSLNGGPLLETGIFNNLSAGTYEVSVNDRNNCSSKLEVTVDTADSLQIALNTLASRCEAEEGEISLVVSGGLAPYRYSLDGVNFQTEPVFRQLASGLYLVYVRDELGCTKLVEAQIKTNVTFADIQSILSANCTLPACHGGGLIPDFRKTEDISKYADRIKIRTATRTMPLPSSDRSLTDEEIARIACWVDGGAVIDQQ